MKRDLWDKCWIVAVLLMLACCAGQTATTSPVFPSPSAQVTELTPATRSSAAGMAEFVPAVYRCACDCEPTPTPAPDVEIYDCGGGISTTWWLTSTFGAVTWMGPALADLRCSIGPAVLVAHVEDPEGKAVEGATVVLHWQDAPMLPLELRQCGLDRGVFGPTNQNGDIGFGLGAGSYYWPPAGGPHTMWVVGADGCLAGLGMIGETEHQALASGWEVSPGAVEAAGEWGYSPGTMVDQATINGRKMWVVQAP